MVFFLSHQAHHRKEKQGGHNDSRDGDRSNGTATERADSSSLGSRLTRDVGGQFDLGEALRVAQRLDDRVVQFYLVGGLGCLAAGAGDVRLAAQLLGAYERLRAETGAVPNAILTPLLGPVYRDTRDALGTTCFEAEVRAGAARARDDAIGFALGDPTSNRAAGRDGHAPLAAREWEVALLVAQGLTNRLIGTRLFISERTVENHIHNTMDKLGFGSRTQIAAWVAERGR